MEQEGGTGKSGTRKEGEPFQGTVPTLVSVEAEWDMVLLVVSEEHCTRGHRIVHLREGRRDIYPPALASAG